MLTIGRGTPSHSVSYSGAGFFVRRPADAAFAEFQNISSFWLVGGKGILIDGGGMIDGQGEVRRLFFASRPTLRPFADLVGCVVRDPATYD